jgi:competence protein ComEC
MFADLFPNFEKHKNKIIVVFLAFLILDFLVWQRILFSAFDSRDLKLYFLDVGQGDSQLVILPGGVKVLIDGGGPNGRVIEELGKILPPTDRYIDLVMMSHPQLDHFGGLIDVVRRYQIGAFLWNGRDGEARAFGDLKEALDKNNIRSILLLRGDKIKYQKSYFDILSPSPEFLKSKELNDTTIVAELISNNSKALFTGDIGFAVEDYLAANGLSYIDILKVGHHGSKFSSSATFLEAIKPRLAFIEVGKNSYGHPTKEALDRLNAVGARVFRTDLDGTMKLIIDGERIKVFKHKNNANSKYK